MLSTARSELYEETARGLRGEVKDLPSVWLYDERGSKLYQEITRLPDYYLPRREAEILEVRAREIAQGTQAEMLVELGGGGAKNTRYLLDALDSLERFVPFDVSEQMLQSSPRYPGISVQPIVGDFERDLDSLPSGGRRLIALLGSTIGNLAPARRGRLFEAVAGALAVDDAFLVGLDLVKDASRLEAAYNDSAGVTEEFVRNALAAVNGELDATFDQRCFAYDAHWDPEHEWVDIGLRAREPHAVEIAGLELEVEFAAGELLRVEISSKFRRERFEFEAGKAALLVESWWTDRAGDFAVALLRGHRKETS